MSLNIIAMAVDPQWWWSAVFMPAAGGVGWLLKHWYEMRKQEHVEIREDRSDQWQTIKEANTILVGQVQGLEAKLQQFDPTLAQIQKEYRETLTREMEGLERERDLRVKAVDLEAKYAQAMSQVAAAGMLRRENQVLRAFIVERIGADQMPSRLEIEGFIDQEHSDPPKKKRS